MKAAVVSRPGAISIENIPDPSPRPGEVVIKIEASGICGTDVHIFKGEYLGDYPIVPGHEGAGTVAAVGEGVTSFAVGDEVAFEPNISCGVCVHCQNNRQNFCTEWSGIGVTQPGCMAEYVAAPRQNVFHTTGLEARVACFMEPLSCVLHGIEKAHIRLGDRVLIAGAGPIGLLLLQSSLDLGAATVEVIERLESRGAMASAYGAATVHRDFLSVDADTYDVVIDATGSIGVLEKLISFVRYGGTMLFFGVAPTGKMMSIEPFQIFRKGLTIVSSYTSLKNSLHAIDMLRTGRIVVDDLISHALGLAELSNGIRLIEGGDPSVKKVVILPAFKD